jgi:hypothetical protein
MRQLMRKLAMVMNVIESIRQKLQRYPEMRFDETPASMTVHPLTPYGFPVGLYKHGNGFTVNFAGWHEEFASETEAIKCFEFGLSEQCRLRVFSRGAFDYRWIVEHLRDGAWQADTETGLLFFPFWLRRKARVLQNHLALFEIG